MLPARFWTKVVQQGPEDDPCWIWVASRNPGGYGQFQLDGRPQSAHRLAYTEMVAEIPAGLQLDHLCRNRACVRPDHLEPVTGRVNLLRGETFTAANVAKTHCPRGHEYAGENMRVDGGHRTCRACERIRQGSLGVSPALRTHCPAGHEYNDVNTYVSAAGRRCRVCNTMAARKYAAARKAAI